MYDMFSAGYDGLYAPHLGAIRVPKASRCVAIISEMPLEELADEELARRYRDASNSREGDLFINEPSPLSTKAAQRRGSASRLLECKNLSLASRSASAFGICL